jgi:two-component system, sensor histidine kinase and response regulator
METERKAGISKMENRALTSCEDAGPQNAYKLPQELLRLAREGEGDLAAEVFALFQSDTTSRLEVLRRAVASGDTGLICAQAHALKGSAGQVGAEAMAEMCRQMEKSANERKMADVTMQFEHLEQHFAEICDVMSRLDFGDQCYGG